MGSVTKSSDTRIARRIAVSAGAGILLICALHLAMLGAAAAGHGHLAEWVGGGLHGGTETSTPMASSEGFFWATLGSFAVPLGIVGAWVVHSARAGLPIPSLVGWGTAGWSAVCTTLYSPGGFPVGIVLGAALVLASRMARRAALVGSPAGDLGYSAPRADTSAST